MTSANYERLSADQPLAPAESGEFPKPAARWQAGPARQKLRNQFNTKEIGAVQMMKKYDKDGNGVLDRQEMKELLQAWNDEKAPSSEDLEFVMLVADKNKDDKISLEEILYALNSWYAFRHMPHSVAQALTSMQIEDGQPIPEKAKVKELLVKLNENIGVDDEQVGHVHNLITELCGGSKVKSSKVRQAVATWYMNIERGETGAGQLGAYAVSATLTQGWDKILGAASKTSSHADGDAGGTAIAGKKGRRSFAEAIDGQDLQDALQGGGSGAAPAILGLLIVAGIAFACFPLYLFYVSFAYPVEETCEHNLNSVLFWSILMWFISWGLFATSGNIKAVCLCVTSFLGFIFQITGFFWSLTSDPENCGRHIFNMCNWFYVIMPFITCAFLCFAPCCWFCFLCVFHAVEASETDNGTELNRQGP